MYIHKEKTLYKSFNINEVKSIEMIILYPHGEASPTITMYLNLNNKEQRNTAENIFKWLKATNYSKQIGGVASKAWPPPEIKITLKNGYKMEISQYIYNQIIVDISNKKGKSCSLYPRLIKSPNLAGYINAETNMLLSSK